MKTKTEIRLALEKADLDYEHIFTSAKLQQGRLYIEAVGALRSSKLPLKKWLVLGSSKARVDRDRAENGGQSPLLLIRVYRHVQARQVMNLWVQSPSRESRQEQRARNKAITYIQRVCSRRQAAYSQGLGSVIHFTNGFLQSEKPHEEYVI